LEDLLYGVSYLTNLESFTFSLKDCFMNAQSIAKMLFRYIFLLEKLVNLSVFINAPDNFFKEMCIFVKGIKKCTNLRTFAAYQELDYRSKVKILKNNIRLVKYAPVKYLNN